MASILKLLQTVDPKTRLYIRYYRISEIYESLLSGLIVCQPDNTYDWLIEKLQLLVSQHGTKGPDLKWDMFIPAKIRPKQKPVDDFSLSSIFSVLDEMLEPTPEMIEKAYTHYNKKLLQKVYFSIRKYHLIFKYTNKKQESHINIAADYHNKKISELLFSKWLEWVRNRKDRQAISFGKLSRNLTVSHLRLIMEEWHSATRESRQTREYFERLERGENIDDGDLLNNNGEARDDMSLLPRNVAAKIFSYLSIIDLYRCAQVCRSWKMITNSNILWSRLNLYPIRHKLNDKLLGSMILKARPYLVHLNLRNCHKLTSSAFVTISGCHNIQDLNLSNCINLTDDLVNTVTIGCHILLYLNLSFNENLTDASIRYLSKNCKNLQYLSIAHCTKITDKGLAYMSMGEGLRQLVHADLSGCLNITPFGFETLIRSCPSLDYLKINNYNELTDYHIKMIAPQFHDSKLTEICILDSPHLTDEAFRYLSNAKQLRKLKIASNRNLTDNAMKYIAKGCFELKYVSIIDCERISDGTLKALANCRNLTVLNLADCFRITDTGIRSLSDGVCSLKLRELNLTNCLCIGNQSMIALAKKCKNIAFLSLNFCENIEEDGIDLIVTMDSLISIDLSGCFCTDSTLKSVNSNILKYASFAGCEEITDLGLQKFSANCSNLESLDLSNCYQLTDNSIKTMAFCCKFLRELNLSGCKMITDMSIQYISGVCSYLQVLDLSNCILISDKSLKYLRKGCRYLKKLVIYGCTEITKETIIKLYDKIPLIEHFKFEDIQFESLKLTN